MKKDILLIEGMHCSSCSNKIEKNLENLEGIIESKVNLANNELYLTYDENIIDLKKIINLINDLGYKAKSKNEKIKKDIFVIEGMHCSSCSNKIEKNLNNLSGISNCSVNLVSNELFVSYDENEVESEKIIELIDNLGYRASVKEEVKVIKKEAFLTAKNKIIISFILLFILFYFSMGSMINLPQLKNPLINAIIQLVLVVPILFLNFNHFKSGFKSLADFSPNMMALVSIGTITAFIYSFVLTIQIFYFYFQHEYILSHELVHNLYYEVAAMIPTIIGFGKYIEINSKKKTSEAIDNLLNLIKTDVEVIRNGKSMILSSEFVKKDDIVIIKPGMYICVDGVIVEGNGLINESFITGESLPVLKKENDTLISGTVNINGYFKLKAVNVGVDTTISKIANLVYETASSKVKFTKLVDKISNIFVPLIILISILTFITWMVLGYGLSFSLSMAISVLVISCPCAIGLATPLAIMVGAGNAAKNGILIKNANAIQELRYVNTIVFDKTGTITKGKPEVESIKIFSANLDEKEILKISASLEKGSNHPLAKAILDKAKDKNLELYDINELENIIGKGLNAKINKEKYYLGSYEYIKTCIYGFTDEIYSDMTTIYLANDNKVLAAIYIKDQIKEDSIKAITELKKMNLNLILLTGDSQKVASSIAQKVGIDKVYSNVTPDEKEKVISDLMSKGLKVAMVGDGINDTPAFSRANVAIAIGSGSDIAIDFADIILMHSGIYEIVKSILVSKSIIRNIKQNLFWAFIYNIIGIPIAAGVFYKLFDLKLNPMISAIFMSLSSIFVVLNTLKMKYKGGSFESR